MLVRVQSRAQFMQNTTLLYLIKKEGEVISEVCLAMKKRSFGVGKWNGVGGKLEAGETLEEGVIRETKEEISITPKILIKKAELGFKFPHKPEWDQLVNVYFCDEWEGEPSESEEMIPKWFSINDMPLSQMWPSDALWLLDLIAGKKLKGNFSLGSSDQVLEHSLEVDENL